MKKDRVTPASTQSYLIVGDGRLARHLLHYFSLLNIPTKQWSRRNDTNLPSLLDKNTTVLLAIKDGAIEEFITSHPYLKEHTCIHFSGFLTTKLAYGVHPLSTFSTALYDLDTYKQIPFFVEKEAPPFEQLLPGLPNSHYAIPKEQKAHYHALCVLSGNFTIMLWQKFFHELEHTFNIPRSAAFFYLQQVASNLQNNSHQALTGPLVRGDQRTIDAHLKTLNDDVYKPVYEAFVEAFSATHHHRKAS